MAYEKIKKLKKLGFFIELLVKIWYFIVRKIKIQKKNQKKESGYMLNDEICKLRDELNKSIITGQDYEVIYALSVELDNLITKYYTKQSIQNIRDKKKRKRMVFCM